MNDATGRSEEKQNHIEASLKELKTKRYEEYEEKLRSGIYRKNRNTLKKNRNALINKQQTLTRKTTNGTLKKEPTQRLQNLGTLIELMDDETNVERDENNSDVETARQALEKTHVKNDDDKPPQQVIRSVSPHPLDLGIRIRSNKKVPTNDLSLEEIEKTELNYEEQKNNYLIQLQEKVDNCKNECKKMESELHIYKSIEERKTFSEFELSHNATLFNLLTKRILDPDSNWKNKIDILVNIPSSIKSDDKILRGGDYMEALFQLAIAINILEQFKNKYIKIYDIDKYKRIKEYEGSYLYTKSVLNSGGSEQVQGISDITFQVSETPFNKTTDSIKKEYKCGEPTSVEDIKIKNEMYFVSVKGFIKEKSIKKDYDIPLLYTQTQFFENANFDGKKLLAVGVKNGDEFRERLDKTRIDFLPKIVRENVFSYKNTKIEKGILDLFEDFRRDFFIKYPSRELNDIENKIRELYPENKEIKPSLSLYYHQELVSRAVINRINNEIARTSDNKLSKPHFMCIGVLPRGGKSYIAGGIIKMYEKQLNKTSGFNVLFMTSAVTETISQFNDDLIGKFADFNDYDFIDIRKIKDHRPTKKNKFIFSSRQFATGKESSTIDEDGNEEKQMKDIFKIIQQYADSIDLVFFDEAHIAVLTPPMQKNFTEAFTRFKAPIILMTATYKKPVNILSGKNDLFVWDLFDIKDMRSLPENGYELFIKQKDQYDVVSRYGDLAIKILEERKALGQNEYQLACPYSNFPEPYFVSPTFNSEIIQKINGSGGFSYDDIFNIQPIKTNIDNFNLLKDTKQWRDWHTLLQNYNHAGALKSYITYNPERTNVFNEIFNNSQKHGATRPIKDKPFSILMFLPMTTESVGALCRIWASFLLIEKYWQDNFIVLTLSPFNDKEKKQKSSTTLTTSEGGYFEIEQIGGDNGCEDNMLCFREKIKGDDLKEKIIDLEKRALKIKKGLLLLSGDVAKMGISLPCVDVVFMLDRGKESDDIIQKMFRALTDSPGKKFGYIVDMNIKRIVEAFFIYDLEKDKS